MIIYGWIGFRILFVHGTVHGELQGALKTGFGRRCWAKHEGSIPVLVYGYLLNFNKLCRDGLEYLVSPTPLSRGTIASPHTPRWFNIYWSFCMWSVGSFISKLLIGLDRSFVQV